MRKSNLELRNTLAAMGRRVAPEIEAHIDITHDQLLDAWIERFRPEHRDWFRNMLGLVYALRAAAEQGGTEAPEELAELSRCLHADEDSRLDRLVAGDEIAARDEIASRAFAFLLVKP